MNGRLAQKRHYGDALLAGPTTYKLEWSMVAVTHINRYERFTHGHVARVMAYQLDRTCYELVGVRRHLVDLRGRHTERC